MAEIFKPRTIEKMFVVMMDLLNNVYVDGKNSSNVIVPTLVPIRVTTSSKIITFWRTDSINTVVPIISIEMNNLAFDESRAQVFPVSLKSRYDGNLTFTPVPYNYDFTVSIFTKKVSMLFDIVEQIIPKFRTMRAYPMLEFKFIDGSEISRDIPITLNSTGIEVQSEWQKDDVQLYYASLGFQLKGFLYHSFVENGTVIGSKGNIKYIEDINIQFHNETCYKFETLTMFETFQTGAQTGAEPIIVKQMTNNL